MGPRKSHGSVALGLHDLPVENIVEVRSFCQGLVVQVVECRSETIGRGLLFRRGLCLGGLGVGLPRGEEEPQGWAGEEPGREGEPLGKEDVPRL